ncbi:SCO family protein [Avrilella dinanensis]|uniref:SCO family protein n=1 Tax=Avrilella dinanensis TaxID=2008672 RepID=A0A2M9R5U5_9FLAO|nr:SCO family protein [Avrilella dinanensis]PJR04211.1 SCO family protein [Avrilella dinanensis]
MKKYSYIVVAFAVLVFGILFVPKIVDGFKNDTIVQNDRLNKSAEKELLTIGRAPEFSFTNQDNETITNDFYDGKVYLVEFFFTSCPTICPIMNENMVKLQNTFKFENNFGIASFTIDPTNDTPEELKSHAKSLGVVNPNWQFLTNTQEEIFALVKNFNLYAAQNDDVPGGFEHSGYFALIDKKGNIRCRKDNSGNPILYYDGTEQEGVEMLKEDIKILLAE